MNRRDFLATGVAGTALAVSSGTQAAANSPAPPILPGALRSPNETRLHVKPVMTDIIHSDVWE